MSREEETRIFFGYNGILYQDAIRKMREDMKKLDKKLEKRIEEIDEEIDDLKRGGRGQ